MKIKTVMISLIAILSIFKLSSMNKIEKTMDEIYTEQDIKNKEEQFISNSYFGNSSRDYKYKKGSIPILISAPHTVKQLRNEKYKKADIYTGALIKTLHEATDAHVIYKTSTKGDENYTTKETKYRKKVKDIVEKNDIKFIIDLHGMTSDKDSDIDIGTGSEKNVNILGQKGILSVVKKSLRGTNYTVNKYFAGGGSNTMSTYCSQKLGVPTLQFEVNGKFRSSNSDNFSYMANRLSEVILNVDKYLQK